ncbi:MAG: hypothetical protein D6689_04535 [Deltaproteobacteria bacterium]|nr:MAG: hypothetical protein D6689_04535 [Deltaproteobacteria bacterium]
MHTRAIAWAAAFAVVAAVACSKDESHDTRKAPAPAKTEAAKPATSAAAPAAASPLAEVAGTYEIDPTHTQVIFRVKHLGVSYQYGRFNKTSGKLSLDADPAKSSVELTIDAGSVYTADQKRDTHLKSPDFFDVKQFPQITFKSTRVKALGGNKFEVAGDLTLHGTTKPVTLQAELTGSGKDPWGGFRVGFEARTKVKRSDFGMTFMLDGLGDEVDIMATLEAVKK